MKTQDKLNVNLQDLALHKCALCPYSTQIISSYKRHLKCHSSDKPLKCPECPFKSQWKNAVDRHVKHVHLLQLPGSRPFPCQHPGCSYAAKDKSKLVRHFLIHSDKKSFFCSHPNCNFSTNEKESLVQHTRLHTGEKPFKCQFESCSFATATRGSHAKHLRTHTKEKPFKCPEPNCEYETAQPSNLKRHQLTHHEPKEGEKRPLFLCPLCEYKGKTKERLTAHVKRHTLEKFFKCDQPNCEYEAKTKTEIQSHKLVHSEVKSFACSFQSCDYRSNLKSSLTLHLKRHSEERRYKCELCSFRAKTRGDVIQHIRRVHSGRNFRPFKCKDPKCDSTFKSKYHFERHLLTHKGDKKYGCSFLGCNYKAIMNSYVNQHEYNIHIEEKKEKCRI